MITIPATLSQQAIAHQRSNTRAHTPPNDACLLTPPI
jgi:hypothetical protein